MRLLLHSHCQLCSIYIYQFLNFVYESDAMISNEVKKDLKVNKKEKKLKKKLVFNQ